MTSHRMAGHVALITGGGAGIGAATAQVFCEQGAALMLVDSDEAALLKTCAGLRSSGIASGQPARVAHCVADVADAHAAVRAVALTIQQFGKLDTLVSNAAMRNYSAIADAQPEEWRALLEVNLLGAANYCRAALPALRAAAPQQAGGASIVLVSSCYGVMGRKGMGLYDASKAALLALTRTLAHEEAPHGIRANAVCPGSTLTDFHLNNAVAKSLDIELLKTQRHSTSLLARWAEPVEIAHPILWLASSEASFMTGATLMVDGGLSVM